MKITRPTLLLDEQKCRANIKRIVDKAKRARVKLRPHFKTHQSHEVGSWFREEGVSACTVSSIEMAAYFAKDYWHDITVAFPVNVLEVEEINRLASFCDLHLCVESEQATRLLTSGLTASVKLFIEIDTGYHRTGIGPDDSDSINAILQVIEHNHHLSFAGFLSHDGHTYHSNSVNEIKRIHDNTLARMQGLGALYRDHFPDLQLSIGDTPSCSLFEDFSGMTEIRPGNLVFYDLTQHAIGCCTQDQIAIAMACPVVALYPEREEIIVHGGGVHFSKDFLARADGLKIYGEVVKLTEGGWQLPPLSIYIKSLSQEHGILHASASDIAKLHVGDMLGVLPVHACLTADAMGEYRIIGGKTVSMM